MFEQYLEAAKEARKGIDGAAMQKGYEDSDDKLHNEYPVIPTPPGFKWSHNAGGFFSYDKELENGKVIRLFGGHEGNRKLREYVKKSDDQQINTQNENMAMLFKDQKAVDDQVDPEDIKRFYNEKQLKAILIKWEKSK